MAAEVIYVTDDLQVITRMHQRPYAARLRTSCPARSKFVIRYARLRKLWEVYDIRRYVPGPGYGQFYTNPPPSIRVEHRDAAIGWAMITP